MSFVSGQKVDLDYNKMNKLKYCIVLLVHYSIQLLDWITAPIFRLIYNGKHRGVPLATDPLLMMSAVELASRIRKRQVCISWKKQFITVYV